MASRELVRVWLGPDSVTLWVGDVCVRSWPACTPKIVSEANKLAEEIRAELQKEFAQRARAVANEGKFREVKHY